MQLTPLLALGLLSLPSVKLTPSFPPPASERGYGLALERRSWSDATKLEAEKAFAEQNQKKADSVASKYPVDYRSNVSDYSLWEQFHDGGPVEPIVGKTGATSIGPTNGKIDRDRPDLYAPPSTDSGSVPNAVWPFSLSHNRLQNGGWARQQNKDVLPVATEMAGVNMRLEEGAYREMHWHSTAEWAYMINGTARVAVVDQDGKNEVSQVDEGDLWYFPSGIPHSIQSISPGGCEFLLVFDSGSFSEDATLLLTDWTAHIPREVLIKNFPGLNDSAFDRFPSSELYIFPGDVPNDTQQVDDPQGSEPVSSSFTHAFSKDKATQLNGGTVKIVDTRTFPVSKTISAAEVTIEPGAMRELHWHPNSDEWDYFLSGHARITVFAGSSNARTYNFGPGDVGYLGTSNGHMIENIGNDTVRYLEVFKAPLYQDVSLSNWLALTPPAVVKAHLGFTDDDLKKLERFKSKQFQIVPGSNNTKRAVSNRRKSFY